jgi:hypothetical protein
MAMKTDDSATTSSSVLAKLRAAPETLDASMQTTDNTRHFVLEATQLCQCIYDGSAEADRRLWGAGIHKGVT